MDVAFPAKYQLEPGPGAAAFKFDLFTEAQNRKIQAANGMAKECNDVDGAVVL